MEYVKGIIATIISEVVVYFLIKIYENSNYYQYLNYLLPYFDKLIYLFLLIPILGIVYYFNKRRNNSSSLIMTIPLGGYEDLQSIIDIKVWIGLFKFQTEDILLKE